MFLRREPSLSTSQAPTLFGGPISRRDLLRLGGGLSGGRRIGLRGRLREHAAERA